MTKTKPSSTPASRKRDKHKSAYEDMSKFYNGKAKEPAGGYFFTVHHRKSPTEHGVWARSKKELEKHFNKIRRHFTSIEVEV